MNAGRPKKYDDYTIPVSFRIPLGILEKIKKEASDKKTSLTEFIIKLIQKYFKEKEEIK